MSDQNTNPYRAELEALAAKPKWELCYGSRKRKIPATVLHMYACPFCTAGTLAVAVSFLLTFFGACFFINTVLDHPLILFGICFAIILGFLLHVNSHFRFSKAELTGLGSYSMMPIELVDHLERWVVTHPVTIDSVETPWKSVKAIKDPSRGRVMASLSIPIECKTLINGVSPNVEKELNLIIDATRSSSGGTDVRVSVEFIAIDQEQSYRTVAAVVSSIVTSVVMQEVALIGGNSTSVRWFISEPIHSRDDVKFRARVKGTLTMGPVDDANAEKRLEYVLREIELAIHRASTQMDSAILKVNAVSLKEAAGSQMSAPSLPNNCSFEIADIELEELESKLPMPIKEKPVIYNDL